MFHPKFTEKFKTNIFILNKTFSENRAVYEIMWKYHVELEIQRRQ